MVITKVQYSKELRKYFTAYFLNAADFFEQFIDYNLFDRYIFAQLSIVFLSFW